MGFYATGLISLLIQESHKSKATCKIEEFSKNKFHFSVNAKDQWAEEIMNDFLNPKDCTSMTVVVVETIAHGSKRPPK